METNTVELTFDYMLSLKMQIEFENNLNIDESIITVITSMYNFLKTMNISDIEIINAIQLLYDTLDPSLKENVSYILSRLNTNTINTTYTTNTTNTQQSLLNFFDIMNTQNNELNNQIDIYTNDFINPTDIINTFQQNINNLHMSLLMPPGTNIIRRYNQETVQDTVTNTVQETIQETIQDTIQDTDHETGQNITNTDNLDDLEDLDDNVCRQCYC